MEFGKPHQASYYGQFGKNAIGEYSRMNSEMWSIPKKLY